MLDSTLSPFRTARARFTAAMGALGLVFGLVLTGIIEWRIEKDLREAAHASLHSIASEIAHTLHHDLETRHREVALMADLLAGNVIDSTVSLRQVIDGLKKRQPVYAWIGLTNATGQVLAATDGLLQGQDVSSRPWFRHALQGAFLGDPHQAKLLAPFMKPGQDGEPPRFLDVAVPLQGASGQVRGVLGAHLYWDWVHDVVVSTTADLARRGPVEVLIADQNGQWLLTPHRETSTQLSELRSVTDHGEYLIATQLMQAVAQTQGLGWTIVVRENIRHAYAPIRESRQFMLLFAAALAVAFAAGTWLVAGKVVQPIVTLARAAQNPRALADYEHSSSRRSDTQETRALGQFMNRLAHYDVLTGLTNRKEVTERIGHAMERTAATRSHSALLLLNIDNFGVFNNIKGHETGDQMLVAVANRLRALLDPQAALSRINGDEFVLLLENLGPEPEQAVDKAMAVAHKLLRSFQAPFALANGSFSTQASLGLYLITAEPQRVAQAMQYAELAMREAKRLGKNQVVVFNDDMREQLARQVRFEEDLRVGIPSQLLVLYQPQVHQNGRIEGAELLVRWLHPEQGMVSPGLFIPLAEATGLIKPMGRWVMETACRQLKQWEDDPRKRELVLAVNVSAMEFAARDYVAQVTKILADSAVNPSRLKLELTESALAADLEDVIGKMHQLKKLGLSLSLDDFGTGFSSLSYLRRMPIDQLKIDQTFVRHLVSDQNDVAIVRTVLTLGKNLGVEVVAEGVEDLAQKERLEHLGCVHFQGYLYGKPMPVTDFERSLQA